MVEIVFLQSKEKGPGTDYYTIIWAGIAFGLCFCVLSMLGMISRCRHYVKGVLMDLRYLQSRDTTEIQHSIQSAMEDDVNMMVQWYNRLSSSARVPSSDEIILEVIGEERGRFSPK